MVIGILGRTAGPDKLFSSFKIGTTPETKVLGPPFLCFLTGSTRLTPFFPSVLLGHYH